MASSCKGQRAKDFEGMVSSLGDHRLYVLSSLETTDMLSLPSQVLKESTGRAS